MSRNLPAGMVAAITSNQVSPAILALFTFHSQVTYVWSGPRDLVFAGNTYVGVGSLGQIGDIVEGTEVRADGTSVMLSGIDPTLLAECLTDIQIGALAQIYFACIAPDLTVIDAPYLLFEGTMDQPVVHPGADEMTIALALETRMANLQRAGQRRYTAADQQLYYPDDSALNWVEILNDQALVWGS